MTQYKETPFEDDTPAPTTTPNRHLRRRIDREVVILPSEEVKEEIKDEAQESDIEQMVGDEEEDIECADEDIESEEEDNSEKSLFDFITEGLLLTHGAVPYYRYFIAIAIMCFLSICLTFISLNAGHEQRRKEKQITILHERSVVKEELRHELSSKSAITERLRKHNIELIDLSKDSRLIEK
jgi:uncharacterized protein YutE (UPF0331/DUF86 family)